MKQAVLLIDCYLYGTIAILAVVLLVLVYLHGQANHLPNPFVRKNIIYRPAPKARGVLLGQKYGLLAYSPERDEGHIIVMGPSGTGKTSALLIPTLRIWQGTALVVDISGDYPPMWTRQTKSFLTQRRPTVRPIMCSRPSTQPRTRASGRSGWNSLPICCCQTKPTTVKQVYFLRKMVAR